MKGRIVLDEGHIDAVDSLRDGINNCSSNSPLNFIKAASKNTGILIVIFESITFMRIWA
jgi:hypothetical protein